MQKSPSPYLHHVIDAISLIREYVEEINEAQFKDNPMVQDAVMVLQ